VGPTVTHHAGHAARLLGAKSRTPTCLTCTAIFFPASTMVRPISMALQMARIAVDDGIHTVACTPHIYPGMYENDAEGIHAAVVALQAELDRHEIRLKLFVGADVHLDLDLVGGIRAGRVPTIAGSRYLLLEPPHHVAPPRFEESVFQLLVAGYVPDHHPSRAAELDRGSLRRLQTAGERSCMTCAPQAGAQANRQPRLCPGRVDRRLSVSYL